MTWIDWTIVFLPVAIMGGVAWTMRRYVRSVADFMAGSRCAGRYVIANAKGEMGMSVVSKVAQFEVFLAVGWTMGWWGFISIPIGMLIALTGWVIYRYRETRALTLAQFFEVRYSRSFRVFAGLLCFISGVMNYGIFPAVAARFFVFFCGLPQVFPVGGFEVQTFAVVMAIYLGISLSMTLTGGQLTVMVTDCLEGLLSLVMFVVAIVVLMTMFSWKEVHEALALAPVGKSKMDPFDTGQIADFNLWFVLIGAFGGIYTTMAWQGGHAFNSAARNAHESKMANIVANWRGFSRMLFLTLLGVCAYTYLMHPDFAEGAAKVQRVLDGVENKQIATQMRMPTALGMLLPVGLKGVTCALFFMGLIACDGSYLHSWGSILVQDIILPFRKKPFSPRAHLLLLRLGIVGVAVFGFFFSLFYRQTDYILMFFAITGAIYMGGAGSAIIGGLYWKRGTAAGAWAGMITGSFLAVSGLLAQQPVVWGEIRLLLGALGESLPVWDGFRAWATNVPSKFPVNGQVMYFIAMVSSIVVYVVVSWLTCREPFDLDRMLHRGRFAKEGTPTLPTALRRFSWGSLLGINHEFTRGDKVISISLFSWKMFWVLVGVVVTLWNLKSRWPLEWWSNYWHITTVVVPLVLTVPTTIWFLWGGIHDLIQLFRDLESVRRNVLDDGTVVDHRNLDEVGEVAQSCSNHPAPPAVPPADGNNPRSAPR